MEGQNQRPRFRFWLGIGAALMLAASVHWIASTLGDFVLYRRGDPEVSRPDLRDFVWILAWLVFTGVVFKFKRPKAIEWTLPFTVVAGLFLWIKSNNGSPGDRHGDEILDIYFDYMFYGCSGVWLFGTAMALTRHLLGEGKQQANTIRATLGITNAASTPVDRILVRSADINHSPGAGLLRSAGASDVDSSDLLVRPVNGADAPQ